MKLRRSPFKVNKIEKDPEAFAINLDEISNCAQALYDRKNILISGTRGIGKSSMAKQMQMLFEDEKRLLQRCDIEASFPLYLTVYYACHEESSLLNICKDILYRIEAKCLRIKTFEVGAQKKFTAAIDLKFVKAALESEVTTKIPASIATYFVNGLKTVCQSLINYTKYKGINILIDEADRLSGDINMGHFLKILHEYMDNDEIDSVVIILAGQSGIYTRLLRDDLSIERLLEHVPITKLNYDESSHILDYARARATPSFEIEKSAQEMILKISTGFPYIMHLLGDAAFRQMSNELYLTLEDVLSGLKLILKSDKGEKYLEALTRLDKNERIILATMALYKSKELPMRIGYKWVEENLISDLDKGVYVNQIIEQLVKKGYIVDNKLDAVCQFNDELFRIFLSLRRIEAIDKIIEETEYPDPDALVFEPINVDQISDTLDYLEKSDMNKAWDYDEYDELMRF